MWLIIIKCISEYSSLLKITERVWLFIWQLHSYYGYNSHSRFWLPLAASSCFWHERGLWDRPYYWGCHRNCVWFVCKPVWNYPWHQDKDPKARRYYHILMTSVCERWKLALTALFLPISIEILLCIPTPYLIIGVKPPTGEKCLSVLVCPSCQHWVLNYELSQAFSSWCSTFF